MKIKGHLKTDASLVLFIPISVILWQPVHDALDDVVITNNVAILRIRKLEDNHEGPKMT